MGSKIPFLSPKKRGGSVNARDAMPNGGTLKILAENLLIDENYAKMHIDAKVGHHICKLLAQSKIVRNWALGIGNY
ncbi:hypothetical protein [Nostoc commune]|uniref:hypothetical protein n=1 Tax=Nostoc commune TaxID=1178 RepID=UPI0018C52FAC|nr:hypothetical protein [Nostoc commune]MBG1257661.1 hypothetical protein [Nostoc commune BAE]